MSKVQGVPITEKVCTNWKTKITGFRDMTDEKWLEIENFSNNIPTVIGELQTPQVNCVWTMTDTFTTRPLTNVNPLISPYTRII